jgi:hypothetical protein
MDINLSPREQEIKKALVNYTVSRKEYFTDSFERLLSKYFSNTDPDYIQINKVWDTFFSIARDDEKNYDAICNDLEKYIENGVFIFKDKGDISNSYEYYLQRLLIHIDDKVYKVTNQFRNINKREPLDLARTIKELVDADGRAGFYPYNKKEKIDGSHIVMTFVKFDQCREWRNKMRGPHSNWVHLPHEVMPKFIESFFIATIVYNYTKDIAAGFSIKTKSGCSVNVIKDGNTIFKIEKLNGNTAKVPIEKKYFGDDMKTTVEVVISAIGFSLATKEYEIDRGKFNRSFTVSLQKDNLKNRKKELEEESKESEKENKQLQNGLNNYENRERAEPEKKGKTANPFFSLNGKSLKIDSDTNNAVIYYTLDKSTPTTKSNKYNKEITLKRNCTIKAIAVADGMENSEVTVYEVDCFKVESVKFEKRGSKLAMTTATESSTIYYTLDGTEPTRNALLYRTMEPIKVKNGMEVKAIAIKNGYNDSELATYTVSGGSTPLSDFIKKYWIWLAGIVFLVLVALTIVRIGKIIHLSSEDEIPAEQSNITAAELFPILDGKAWQVKEMEGTKIPDAQGSAKIVSINDEGTDCKMVITTNLRSQYREINFQYNRLTGSLYSPELGEGKVEKLTGFVTLKISFKGWIIEK